MLNSHLCGGHDDGGGWRDLKGSEEYITQTQTATAFTKPREMKQAHANTVLLSVKKKQEVA